MKLSTKTYLSIAAGISLFALSLAFHNTSAQQNPVSSPASMRAKTKKEEIISRLEKLIPQLMTDGDVPGLSIALIQNSEIVWHHGYGVKNSQTKEPVTDDTLFEAASLSKPVFAYAVLKLADNGKIDLDTPLNKYLPGNYEVGDDPRINQITARHVLSHTPGFPNWRPLNNKVLKIHFTPGERFSYSGEGFVYLAKVIEHLTGETINNFMKKSVFEPLGMTSSSYVWQDNFATLKAFGHSPTGEPRGQNKVEKANAAASLVTTAQDFGKFLSAILKGKGLKNTTLKQMLTAQIKVSESGTNNTSRMPDKFSPSLSWGLGAGLQNTADGVSFWHWGDNGNTKAFFVAFDKHKTGVVVFTNSANGLSIIPDIVDAAVGGSQPALAWLKYESYKSPAKVLFKNILAKGVVEALAEYREWRKGRKSEDIVNEPQMNRIGYNLIGLKRMKDAIEVFKLNVEDYPQSFNAYDSLGEAYNMNGNKELAIQNYKRSVELNPNSTSGIEALKKLTEK
jgi:CubicO group peptidase (beta-lactamase class C family)